MLIIMSGIMLNFLVIGALTRPIEDNYLDKKCPVEDNFPEVKGLIAETRLESVEYETFEMTARKLEASVNEVGHGVTHRRSTRGVQRGRRQLQAVCPAGGPPPKRP
jgi:hypothetical protein